MRTFDIATDVTLECPICRQYKTVPRSSELPAEVRLIKIICPDCDDGDRHTETWFSAPGIEVSQDRDRVARDGPQIVCCACGSERLVRMAPPLCAKCDPSAPPDSAAPQKVCGVFRFKDNPRALLIALSERPTDDEIRSIHDYLRGWQP